MVRAINFSGTVFLYVPMYVVVTGLSLWDLCAVMNVAIVAGVREHAVNSVIAVSVVCAVPFTVAEAKSELGLPRIWWTC